MGIRLIFRYEGEPDIEYSGKLLSAIRDCIEEDKAVELPADKTKNGDYVLEWNFTDYDFDYCQYIEIS
jgi:hypothetical protein